MSSAWGSWMIWSLLFGFRIVTHRCASVFVPRGLVQLKSVFTTTKIAKLHRKKVDLLWVWHAILEDILWVLWKSCTPANGIWQTYMEPENGGGIISTTSTSIQRETGDILWKSFFSVSTWFFSWEFLEPMIWTWFPKFTLDGGGSGGNDPPINDGIVVGW